MKDSAALTQASLVDGAPVTTKAQKCERGRLKSAQEAAVDRANLQATQARRTIFRESVGESKFKQAITTAFWDTRRVE